MSTLKVTNIAGLTGSSTDVMQGLCKAWSSFNGTGTIASRDSFNVGSLTDFGTGQYKVTFTTNMNNSSYTGAVHGNNRSDTNPGASWFQTWSTDRTDRCAIELSQDGGSNLDGAQVGTIVHGDLA